MAIPRPGSGGPRFQFAKMEVGDSFLVPIHLCNNVKAAASQFGKRNGMKLTTRILDEGVRVWRVE